MKIIQIDGIKGLISAVFIGACLFAGFVIFPGYAAMYLWNKYLAAGYMFPALNLFQGALLWSIVVISYCILSKSGLAVSFRETPELSQEELDKILKNAKFYSGMPVIPKVIKSEKIELPKNDKEQTFISSPLSKTSKSENVEDEKVSNLK